MKEFTAINVGLRKPAPDRFRLTPPGCRNNDFYEINITIPELEWRFLARTKVLGGYSGILWAKGAESGLKATILKQTLNQNKFELEIRHHYKCHEELYKSAISFLIQDAIKKPMWVLLKDRLAQSIFNKKTLTRTARMDLLNYMVERTLTNQNFKANPLSIGQEMHSIRWIFHPDRSEHQAHFRLLLDSLESSGDLEKDQYSSYKIKPKALSTISEYEEAQQRHHDNINSARTSQNITRALVFVGFISVAAQFIMWLADKQ